MQLVFMGTPEFAVPALRALCAAGLRPVRVYSQPARPAGRGGRTAEPPVTLAARAEGLPVRQPERLQTRAELADIEALAPDLIVTVAYGKIFRRRLLGLPRWGCLNLHPSLLPRYRGLSPIQWALLRGDEQTGVTVYRMEEGVDAGPILLQETLSVRPDDRADSLAARLAERGAELLCQAVRGVTQGTLLARPQDAARASYAPRLEREHGLLDWRLPAAQVARLVRAMSPWPGTYAYLGPLRVKILAVEVRDEAARRVLPGTILGVPGRDPLTVAALPGALLLTRVQPEGGRPQDGSEFARGRRLAGGERLRAEPSSDGGRA